MRCLGANLARNLIWSEVSREFQLTVNIEVLPEALTKCEELCNMTFSTCWPPRV
jgi:hypothetical protein